MDKLRVYQAVALLLLLVNMGLAFLLFRGAARGGHAGPAARKTLSLNAEQEAIFHQRQQEHQRAVKASNQLQRAVLRDWFAQLKSADASKQPAVPPAVNRLETEKIRQTYAFLFSVKSMLNEDQLVHYPEFTDQFLRRVLAAPPRPKMRKHDR